MPDTTIRRIPREKLAAILKTPELVRLFEDVLYAISTTLPADTTALEQALNDHIALASDAHQASAIGNTPAGGIAANTVQGALNELDTDKLATSVLDTDGTLAANSDARVATQKAVKTYADNLVAAQDAMVFKGVIDCSANPNYPAADRGDTYRVSVAGKIGGASGTNVEVGDILLCLTDGSAAGDQAAVGANWAVVQANIDGAVVGPASAVNGNVPVFDGITGKVIEDSGKAAPAGAFVGTTDTQTLTGKTLDDAVATGTLYLEQAAPASKAGAATLTAAELLAGLVQYTGAAASLTLPTGSDIEAGVLSGLAADRAFDFGVINTGSGTATIATAAGLTLVGAMTVDAGASGLFRVRRTAADTYSVYRLA